MDWARRSQRCGHIATHFNSLNAFPVPDQDTGSNLVYTLDALNKAFSEGLDTLLHDLHALTTGYTER